MWRASLMQMRLNFKLLKQINSFPKSAQKAEYQKQTSDANESQYEMIKKLELDEEAHHVLMEYCQAKNILFLSTPFDHESIELLDNLGLRYLKFLVERLLIYRILGI